MSDEELISQWKKGAKVPTPSTNEPTATNPAGPGELSEQDLESIAGGSAAGTESFQSIGCCTSIFCKPEDA